MEQGQGCAKACTWGSKNSSTSTAWSWATRRSTSSSTTTTMLCFLRALALVPLRPLPRLPVLRGVWGGLVSCCLSLSLALPVTAALSP